MQRSSFLKSLLFGGAGIVASSKIKANIVSDTITPTIKLNEKDKVIFDFDKKEKEPIHPIYKNYRVNEKGEIFSLPRHGSKGGKLKISVHKTTKQLSVRISENGKTKTLPAARIIFEAFSGKLIPSQSYIIVYKDGNKNNLNISNLECIPKKEHTSYKPKGKSIRNNKGQIVKWI
jgi:hypothetical protein